MTDLSNFDVLAIIVTILAIFAGVSAVVMKRHSDALHRLVERDEEEIARREG